MAINIGGNLLSSTGFNTSSEILNTPSIVTDSLILWLDAGNLACYNNTTNYYDCGYGCQYYGSDPGCTNCNTQLKDMSGLGNDGNLSGGAAVVYSNIGGYVNFDNTANKLVKVQTISSFGNNTTWSAWIYCLSDVSTYNMFMGRWLPYFGFYGGNSLYFSNQIGGVQSTIQSSASYTTGAWYNAVFTTEYSGGNTSMKIYVNGNLDGNNSFSGAQSNGGTFFCVGDGDTSSWYRFNGYVPIIQIYNKTLSTTEITQNFNAGRQRFGI
jgi:hypothetical protein